jgi:cell filamentation protein
MYEAPADPYCFPGSAVLKNIPGIRDQRTLEHFEAAITAQRADEPLPAGRLSVTHYRAIHHHLFQDVYAWAGRFRTVRISKGQTMFCYPENIAQEMMRLFTALRQRRFLRELSAEGFAAGLAHFLAELNAIHPFREGNGRTQLTFAVLIGVQAEHELVLDRLRPDPFLAAMIASFSGHEAALASEIRTMLR